MKSRFIHRPRRSVRSSRRGSPWTRLVPPAFFFLAVVLGFSRPGIAATVVLTSPHEASSIAVGDVVDLTAALALAEQEAPGIYEIVLRWGGERELTPLWIGALVLHRLPSVASNASLSVEAGDDCAAGIGSSAGTCTLRATVLQATSQIPLRLASLDFAYRWIPEPGYEICLGVGSDGCVAAGQDAGVLGMLADGSGADFISMSTFALPGVRPIPEPTTASLLVIGLGLLATRRFFGSSRPAVSAEIPQARQPSFSA